jgi:hypothetical protein
VSRLPLQPSRQEDRVKQQARKSAKKEDQEVHIGQRAYTADVLLDFELPSLNYLHPTTRRAAHGACERFEFDESKPGRAYAPHPEVEADRRPTPPDTTHAQTTRSTPPGYASKEDQARTQNMKAAPRLCVRDGEVKAVAPFTDRGGAAPFAVRSQARLAPEEPLDRVQNEMQLGTELCS